MKHRKTEFKYFTIPDWKKEQDYLRMQHRNGWKFVDTILLGFYRFEKCEPEDVVYQLDYNPDGTANKDEYVQMFRDCGWEYLLDYCGYSYFRKPASKMSGEEAIFCDDASRLDMMNRVFKGRMLPLLVPLFCIILPNIFIQRCADSFANDIIAGCFVVILVFYLTLFIKFGIQIRNLKKNQTK